MNTTVKKIALIGLFAALSYAAFTFLQFKIPLPGGDAVSIHMGNAVVILAALLIGGLAGGTAGALGMTIGDLLDPVYIIYAPKTFVCKLFIGIICGAVAHKVFKLSELTGKKDIVFKATIAAVCGMLFNVIFDPLIGYYYKLFILGKPVADVALAWNVGITGFNAVTSVIVGVSGYLLLKPVLNRSLGNIERFRG